MCDRLIAVLHQGFHDLAGIVFRKMLPHHLLRLGDQIAFREAQGVVGLGDIVRDHFPDVLALHQDFGASVLSGVGGAFLKFLDNGPVGAVAWPAQDNSTFGQPDQVGINIPRRPVRGLERLLHGRVGPLPSNLFKRVQLLLDIFQRLKVALDRMRRGPVSQGFVSDQIIAGAARAARNPRLAVFFQHGRSLLPVLRQGGDFLLGDDIFAVVVEKGRKTVTLDEAVNREGV